MLAAMEATSDDADAGPEPAAALPRYLRMPKQGIVAGVAAGLFATTGIDVVALRIALVVLVFLHGAGLLAYLAAWVALPTLADAQAGVRPRYQAVRSVMGAALAAAAVIVIVTPFGFASWELVPLLVGIGLALWRSNPPRTLLPPGPAGQPVARPSAAPVGPPAGPSAATSSPGFPVGHVTVAVVLLATAVALAMSRTGAAQLTAGRGASLVLVVLGAGLVAGAFLSRSRWMVLPALALVPITLGLATLDHMGLDLFAPSGSYGVAAGTASDVPDAIHHGAGDVNIDLRRLSLAAGDSRSITVDAALGNITVWVPAGSAVRLDAEAGWGDVEAPGASTPWGIGATANAQLPGDGGSVLLHLRTGVGSIAVVRGGPDIQPVGP
jgi:phage shock protein PspC (stress-responsive transcriptional regulator)